MALITHQRSLARSVPVVEKTRSVLLAVAERTLRMRVGAALQTARWFVTEAAGGAEALAELDRDLPEVLLVGPWLPDLQTEEFASFVARLYPHLDIVNLDGETLNRGVRSERRQELLTTVRESIDQGRKLQVAGSKNPAALPRYQSSGLLIGSSPAMRELQEQIDLVSGFPTTVLIEGETGTGKELVAKAVHASSLRAQQPFIVLNCAAIPEALLEAELFGHTRGAFTGAVQARLGRIEAADGGTIFLDEIGEMPLALQAKMLRFLENGELQRVGENLPSHVDVRVIAATHRRLEQMCGEGQFRLDLFHRLAVFPIDVPPLRDRLEDLVQLSEHFLDQLASKSFRKQLTPDALEQLLVHTWPGNVRELMHVLERAVILSGQRSRIEKQDIRVRQRPRV